MEYHRLIVWLRLLVAVIYILFCIVNLPQSAFAALPPRPTSPVTVITDPSPAGTLILNTKPFQGSLWSVVQWRDNKGNWNDVVGWRGSVVNGMTIWWVEKGDWGKGIYRWVVFQSEGGNLLAVSEPFNLPNSGEKLTIEVKLPL